MDSAIQRLNNQGQTNSKFVIVMIKDLDIVYRKCESTRINVRIYASRRSPLEFPNGWKIWPGISLTRNRSIFSLCSQGTFRAVFVWPWKMVSVSVCYLKVKNDHRSKFSNLSNWKEEAWKKKKKSGLQRDPTSYHVVHVLRFYSLPAKKSKVLKSRPKSIKPRFSDTRLTRTTSLLRTVFFAPGKKALTFSLILTRLIRTPSQYGHSPQCRY